MSNIQDNLDNYEIDFFDLTEDEEKLLNNFRALNSENKQKLKDLILSFDIDESEIK